MKTVIKSNFRVVVEPKRLGDYGCVRVSDSFGGKSKRQIEVGYINRCYEIVDQIKRHVDNFGSIDIQSDEEYICSYCECDWSVSEDDSDPKYPKGTPLCCEEARAEFLKK